MTRDEAVKSLERIEQLISCFGGPSGEDHREFNSLLFSLRSGPFQNQYFREKLSELEQQANIGFSARKFEKYPGGLSQVRVKALGSLLTAQSLVEKNWLSA